MKLADRVFRRGDWKMTSPFGMRMHPVEKKWKMHTGTDYGTGGQKWPQYALEDGTVTQAGKDGTGAIYAWVHYPRLGIEVQHYHLDRLFVRAGQNVTKDTIIGNTGTTGKSTGVHLHMSLRKHGSTERLDPHAYDYTPPSHVPVSKSESDDLDAIAKSVIYGKWGNGDERKRRLRTAGYDAEAVQKRVNEILKSGG